MDLPLVRSVLGEAVGQSAAVTMVTTEATEATDTTVELRCEV